MWQTEFYWKRKLNFFNQNFLLRGVKYICEKGLILISLLFKIWFYSLKWILFQNKQKKNHFVLQWHLFRQNNSNCKEKNRIIPCSNKMKYFTKSHSFLLLMMTNLRKFSVLTVWSGLGVRIEFKILISFPEQENHSLFFCLNKIS